MKKLLLIMLFASPEVFATGKDCVSFVETLADREMNGGGIYKNVVVGTARANAAISITDRVVSKYGFSSRLQAFECVGDGVQQSSCKLYPSSSLCIKK